MEYSIKKLSEMAGVSSRTLRYYDTIDLLKPKRINSSGYRIYGKNEVDRLQQILFFREFEIPLEEIKKYLDDQSFDNQVALAKHRQQLLAKRARIDQLLSTIDKTMRHNKGENDMTDKEKFMAFKQKQLQENEEKFGNEIREKYGKETVEKSNQQYANLTEEQYHQLQTLAEQIITNLKAAMETKNPEGEAAQAVAALHKEWLSFTWPSYSKEAHQGLAEMYVFDERFRKYYDGPAGEGAAQFLRDAIYHYTKD